MTIQQRALQLQAVDMTNFNGKTLSLLSLFDGFRITEDLFSTVLYGSISITDSVDLLHNFPVIGEEQIRVKFKTDRKELPFLDLTFYVYCMTDFQESDQGSRSYVLHFTSEEMLLNRTQMISRSFKNMNPDKVVADILKSMGSTKPLNAEPTFGIQTYIAPNIHPFEAIQSMTARARSSAFSSSSGFLFYETVDGFNFRSIDQLITQSKTHEYTMSQAGTFTADAEDKFYAVLGDQRQNSFDILKTINSGMLGNIVHVFDIQARSYKISGYNYFKDQDYIKSTHLEGQNPKLRLHTSKFRFKDRVQQSVLKFVPQYENDQLKDSNLPIRYSQLNQIIDGPKRLVEINGNSEIRVGDKFKLKLPNTQQQDRAKQIHDMFLSGLYLVTSVAHIISGDKYSMSVELVKDSYQSDHEEFADELFAKIGEQK